MNYPPSSWARSFCAGVLGQDRYKGKLCWDGYSNVAQNPPSRKGAESRPLGARMAWLQLPATRQPVSVSHYGKEADPHPRHTSAAMELDNCEGSEPQYASSHTGENAYLLPYSDD